MPMIIEKKTAAETSTTIHVSASQSSASTFLPVGTLEAGEEIEVKTVDQDGATNPLYDADGIAVTLTATSNPLAIYSPMWLQFVKPITSNAVGVMMVQ